MKIPAFQGHGGDGGPGDGGGDDDGNGDADGDMQPSGPPEQWSYIKSPAPSIADEFGYAIAIASNGATLAVGAPSEDGSASTINGVVTETTLGAGAVNVFIASSNTWSSQAYIKPFNPGADDNFGFSVALSKDGSTLAVGAPFEDGNAGSGPGSPNDSAQDAGAVYVFVRDAGGAWTFQAYLKASNVDANDLFGWSVALSDTGDTLVVGALREASNATDVNGNGADNSVAGAGAAYVFNRSGSTWGGPVYLKPQPQSVKGDDAFGNSVAISGDGTTIAVGAPAEDSSTTGVNPAPNESRMNSGAIYVFQYTGADPPWAPQAFLKATISAVGAQLGFSVALSRDGNVLVAGAPKESSTTGKVNDGLAYVYTRASTTWTATMSLAASNNDMADNFGTSVAIARDASTILIGAPGESSNSTGIGADETNNVFPGAGAAYLFSNTGVFTQSYYIKASNTNTDDQFGCAVSIADVGGTFAIAAKKEDSSATSPSGNQALNDLADAGAAYVFRSPL